MRLRGTMEARIDHFVRVHVMRPNVLLGLMPLPRVAIDFHGELANIHHDVPVRVVSGAWVDAGGTQ